MENTVTAKEYFEGLKAKKQTIEDQDLKKVYDNCMNLLNKYQITGQIDATKKLIFHLETIEKERAIVKKGINTFVYLNDITEYIEKVNDRSVKCIELPKFEREIPDDIVEAIAETKDIFDEFFVVFTDYTKVHEQKIQKERDPILFGMFKDNSTSTIVDRMYFIGDWEDEYCDLTLDKLVNEANICLGENITRTISTPTDIQELKTQLNALKTSEGNNSLYISSSLEIKKSFFRRVRSFLFG